VSSHAPLSAEVSFWIDRIAINYCLNQLRNRKLRPRPNGDVVEEQHRPSGGDGSDETVMANRDLARRVIRNVPRNLGIPAWLHYVDGRTHEEIRVMTGVSRRTVINHIAEFRRRARTLLNQER
jgi:DNA-directed RNA polymerase specialized sigma24 family protein